MHAFGAGVTHGQHAVVKFEVTREECCTRRRETGQKQHPTRAPPARQRIRGQGCLHRLIGHLRRLSRRDAQQRKERRDKGERKQGGDGHGACTDDAELSEAAIIRRGESQKSDRCRQHADQERRRHLPDP